MEPAIGYLKAVQGGRPFLWGSLAKVEPEWRFPWAVANVARIRPRCYKTLTGTSLVGCAGPRVSAAAPVKDC